MENYTNEIRILCFGKYHILLSICLYLRNVLFVDLNISELDLEYVSLTSLGSGNDFQEGQGQPLGHIAEITGNFLVTSMTEWGKECCWYPWGSGKLDVLRGIGLSHSCEIYLNFSIYFCPVLAEFF